MMGYSACLPACLPASQSATQPWIGWMTNQLTNFYTHSCDADPDVLADYVLALLKHDKSTPDLKELCTSQLVDFLKEGKFVR